MGWLEGYVGAVTGGAGGIGRAVVERYLAEGARGLVVLDRNAAALRALEAAHGETVVTIEGDVRDAATHRRMADAAQERFGGLDVLVGNAGLFDFRRPLAGYTPQTLSATFDELFGVNLQGYLQAALAVRALLEASGGSMIFTASVASFDAGGGGVLYTAVKHAVVGMIRQLALELAPAIRVNGVGPGGTLTGLGGTAALGHAGRSLADRAALSAERIAAAAPLGFAQRPEDHAGLYVLLASRENARAVTGQIFMSDGGAGVRSL